MKLTKQKLYQLIQEQLDQKALEKVQTVIAKGDIPKRYALYVVGDDKVYNLILYQIPPLETKVVGFCQIAKTKEPCIPTTYEVGAIARESGNDYRGLGAVMYDLAATLVKRKHDAGITSDHESSTSEAAYKVWQKMLNSGKYVKRKTAMGKNDKFDYDNSTPNDPADDCSMPKGSDVAASDHSLQIKEDSPYLGTFLSNHTKAMEVAEEASKALGKKWMPDVVEAALEEAGQDLFARVYTGPGVKKLTKNYFNVWNTIKRAIGLKEEII
tara:strand:- start:4360 stop:5166 length:807 start_codon:yes stop_codon:yes gene_type:complete